MLSGATVGEYKRRQVVPSGGWVFLLVNDKQALHGMLKLVLKRKLSNLWNYKHFHVVDLR